MPNSQIESDLREVYAQQASSVSSDSVDRVTSRNYRPRVRRSARTRRIVLSGVLAGAAATVAVAVPLPWDHGAGLASTAFAVTPDGDGAVTVEATWSELRDPSALQAELDQAGARTRIYVTGNAPHGGVAECADYVQTYTGDVPAGAAIDGGSVDDGHLDVTVHPDLFPPDSTMVVIVGYLEPVDGGAVTFRYFATGSLPNCAPTVVIDPQSGGASYRVVTLGN